MGRSIEFIPLNMRMDGSRLYESAMEFFIENNIALDEGMLANLKANLKKDKQNKADKEKLDRINDIDTLEKIAVIYVRYVQSCISSFMQYVAVDTWAVDEALKNPGNCHQILQEHDDKLDATWEKNHKHFEEKVARAGSTNFVVMAANKFVKEVYKLKNTDEKKYNELADKFGGIFKEVEKYTATFIVPWGKGGKNYNEYTKKTDQLAMVGGQEGTAIANAFWKSVGAWMDDALYDIKILNDFCLVPFGRARYNEKNGNMIIMTLTKDNPKDTKVASPKDTDKKPEEK